MVASASDPDLHHLNFDPMKKLIMSCLLLTLLVPANAQQSGFGLGIMLGEPTGLSGKLWTGGENAIGMGLAWGGLGSPGGYLHMHADYLWHKMDLIPVSKGKLPLYFGIGARLRIWDDNGYYDNGKWEDDDGGRAELGVRLPVGLAYLFDGAPVDIFLEVVPVLDLIPDTDVSLNAAIGARYWF